MYRFLLPLVIIAGCIGCATVGRRDLTIDEVRATAAAEIRRCCQPFTSDQDLRIERTLDGWSVSAPSTCPKYVPLQRSASTFGGGGATDGEVDEIEGTAILCVGGGAALRYDKQGKLLKLIRWQ